MHAGSWSISTGPATFTTDDLAAAVGALDCPAVRRPVLRLGHVDPRFDGEPAVGWVDNVAVAEGGRTMVGDYVGMPGWLGDVIASAYPDRSIEGVYNYRCQIGHLHPFVLTAVALLGVTRPGIGTLSSLQDVARLYGVDVGEADVLIPEDVAAGQPDNGTPVTITCKGAPMPSPKPIMVAGAVSTEDVRREFYDDANWSQWITEIQLDPLQLIVCDDNNGKHYRVPVVVNGEDFEFGEPVEVVIVYEDVPAKPADTGTPAAASASTGRLVFASRAESRPGADPKATQPAEPAAPAAPEPALPAAVAQPPVPPAAEPEPTNHPEDTVSDLSEIRSRLGLAADADETALLAALDDVLDKATAPPATPEQQPEPVAAATKLPEGVVVIEKTKLDELTVAARAGEEARRQQITEARDNTISAAVHAGKIAPARVEHWTKAWDADPDGTKQTLASLEPGLVVPVAAKGHAGSPEPEADDHEFDHLFPPQYANSTKGA